MTDTADGSGGRIDTHTHVVPPAYASWLRNQDGYRGPVIGWSADRALEWFAATGISTGVLSVSAPGIPFDAGILTVVNEFSADVVRADPASFGFFASVELPEVDASLAAAAYAFDELDADGVVLSTRVGAEYLGSPWWRPLLEYLDARSAVVLVHPTALPAAPLPGVSPGVVDFLAETTRAAVNLLGTGCLTRFPNLSIILAHGGGYVPYAADRIAAAMPAQGDEAALLELLTRFYFDTALVGGPHAMPSLLALARPDRLTFGSDWPYEIRPGQATAFTRRLDEHPMPEHDRFAMRRGNAERLFPRLAAGKAPGTA